MADENDKRDEITNDEMKFQPERRDAGYQPRVFCAHCGYPLEFLAEHRCPECGQAFDPNDPDTYFENDDWMPMGMFGSGVEVNRAQEALSAAGIDSMLEFMPESQNLGFYREQNHSTQLLVHAGDARASQPILAKLHETRGDSKASNKTPEQPIDANDSEIASHPADELSRVRRGCLFTLAVFALILLIVTLGTRLR